jgi:L-ribulose-5-phosphate 3-epimerase
MRATRATKAIRATTGDRGVQRPDGMKLGYNTNGLAFHRWTDALPFMADVGYEAVAITLDHHCLDPFSPALADEVARMREMLDRLQFRSVIETGARFLLDPRAKHEPTLLTSERAGRARRIDFLKRAIDIAAALKSDAVSFWSGCLREEISATQALARLAEGCREVIDYAGERQVPLAFEPEPGMLIDTFAQFSRLVELVDAPHFGLTIDIGHVQCVETGAIPEYLREWSGRLRNVHIEDMCRGAHEHLRFGTGEIDFPPVLRALHEIGYAGCVNVELSRHSHLAPEVLRESFEFLDALRSNESQ